jgi:predicted nucleotidyltransferase
VEEKRGQDPFPRRKRVLTPFLHPLERRALAETRAFVAWCLGPRLRALLLCGARARGDPEPDADLEVVAVVEGDRAEPTAELRAEEEDLRDALAELIEPLHQTLAFALVTEAHLAACRGHPLCASARRSGQELY